MAEQLNLTAPITPPTLSSWRVEKLNLDWGQVEAAAEIFISLRGTNGELFTHRYSGATARTFLIALNKTNLSTTSLQKRILDRLVTDGILTGTVSGTPD